MFLDFERHAHAVVLVVSSKYSGQERTWTGLWKPQNDQVT